jgi:hypothetical protein
MAEAKDTGVSLHTSVPSVLCLYSLPVSQSLSQPVDNSVIQLVTV